MVRAFRFFLFMAVSLMVARPAFAEAMDACRPTCCLEQDGLSQDAIPGSQESSDCHCVVHHFCGHPSLLMMRSSFSLVIKVKDANRFRENYFFNFSSPFLEGPFQPPKV